MAKPIKITETILRDAHQSLIATRMTTEQMLPIIDKMDQLGWSNLRCIPAFLKRRSMGQIKKIQRWI